MKRTVGTVARGVRTPIIREGDNLVKIVVDSLLDCSKEQNFSFNDKDVVAVTEAVLARSQGNYATTDQIAKDIKDKFNTNTLGIIFPILSRNRFAICLKGIAKAMDKIYLMLSFPSDEVGNQLFAPEKLLDIDVNPYTAVLDIEKYRKLFGYDLHPFTGVDYIEYYKEIIVSEGCQVEFLFSNNPSAIVNYTKNILTCDIHTREATLNTLRKYYLETVLNLEHVLAKPVDGSGYNENYGLLGSNAATADSVKLFPRACKEFVFALQEALLEKTGKTIEVMINGDGAFKDPVGKIWELADPVVSPAYTYGLEGTPNEMKLKYLADNDFAKLKGKELEDAIKAQISQKETNGNSKDSTKALGTTPRQLTDLLGSLADLTSGSGDKGTPVVLIQGYFDNYSM